MKITNSPKHIFWSYKPNADLPEETVVEQVLLYGDVMDMFKLSKETSSTTIKKVNDKIKNTGRWKKRVYFVEKLILDE